MDSPSLRKYTAVQQFAPSTFEERGTNAPFTTPVLSCSRVRVDERHGLVLLTSGFVENSSVYVVPWSHLPDLVAMSMHDRALHEAIEAAHATDPASMRREVLRVAASGLAGPEVQRNARRTLEAEARYADEIHAVIIVYLLRKVGLDVSTIIGLDLESANGASEAKAALAAATTPLGVEPEALYERVGMLAATLSSVGLGGFGRPGRLRVLLDDLAGFRDEAQFRGESSPTEAQISWGFAAEVANHTLGMAEALLNRLDRMMYDPADVIRAWDRRFPEISGFVARVAWLLDGWDYAIAFTRRFESWRPEEVGVNLETLLRMLPIVPKGEAVGAIADDERRFSELIQRKRVGAQEDWRTGRLDLELRRRLEEAKAAALAAAAPVHAAGRRSG